MNDDKIELSKLLEWTLSTIHYYCHHRTTESDKKPFLDKIIEYCKKERENL